MVKQVVLLVMSARRPKVKHTALMEMPRMVRNWRCHPNDLFWVWLVLDLRGVGSDLDGSALGKLSQEVDFALSVSTSKAWHLGIFLAASLDRHLVIFLYSQIGSDCLPDFA